MEPIDISNYSRENVRELAAHCHELMLAKIAELDAEVAQRNATGK
jgi:1-acyl-sn-glycerol-3-phosphate acyltransferase